MLWSAVFGEMNRRSAICCVVRSRAASDGRGVGLHHNTGTRNGKRLDTDCCIVSTPEDGRVVEGREHFYDLAKGDDFWS